MCSTLLIEGHYHPPPRRNRPTRNTTMKHVATFLGVQEGLAGVIPDFELWDLHEAMGSHPAGSTVSRQTLEALGVTFDELKAYWEDMDQLAEADRERWDLLDPICEEALARYHEDAEPAQGPVSYRPQDDRAPEAQP